MFGFEFKGFSNMQKGVLCIIVGTVLLMHTLNILQTWLNLILIVTSVALIIYGLIKIDALPRLMALTKRGGHK